jgi:flagellar assembly protein FliH
MRSLSDHNVLKAGWIILNPDEKRVIDSNEVIRLKFEKKATAVQEKATLWTGESFDGADGEIREKQVEGLVQDGADLPDSQSFEDRSDEMAMTAENSKEDLLAETQNEIEQMKQHAQQEIEEARGLAMEEARTSGREQGYQKGYEEGQKHSEEESRTEMDKLKNMENEYQDAMNQLEPLFVENLTKIYEHVFHIELSEDHEVILHLLDTTLHGIESGKDFIIRVSKEDYPFVGMQKKLLLGNLSNATIEIVEDITLKKNECLVETGGGIFDCSVDVELFSLSKSLKLLSYQSEKEG